MLSQRVRDFSRFPASGWAALPWSCSPSPAITFKDTFRLRPLILLTFAVPGVHASPVAQTLALGNQRARREPRCLGANPGALGAQSSRRAGHPAARSPRRERSAIQLDATRRRMLAFTRRRTDFYLSMPARQPTRTGCVRHGRAALQLRVLEKRTLPAPEGHGLRLDVDDIVVRTQAPYAGARAPY